MSSDVVALLRADGGFYTVFQLASYVDVCVCNIPLYIFIFAVYLLVHVCSDQSLVCLFTDNFGLYTEIAVCKFLRGWRLYGLKPFYFELYVLVHFSAAFCTAHCALDLDRDHAP